MRVVFDVTKNEAIELDDDVAAPQTKDEIINRYTALIQQRLDDFARTRGYDSILSACTYATSTTPQFKAEGQRCVELRDATWAKATEIMQAVQSGARSMPTWDELQAELPVLEWPA